MQPELIKKETPAKEVSVTRKVTEKKSEVKDIVVRNEDDLLEPEKAGNKLAIPKTWLSEKQMLKIIQRTPKEHIYKRPGKGGQTWEYVTGVYVEKVLNFVFGWNWDFEIVKQESIGLETGAGQVITLGKLTVKDDHGHVISKMQNGRADIKYKTEMENGKKIKTSDPLDLGNDYKASSTDALKKCASLLGIASDIYGKNEFKEVFAAKEVTAKPVKKEEVKKAEAVIEFECNECANPLTKAEADYSKKIYKKQLCRTCQKLPQYKQ